MKEWLPEAIFLFALWVLQALVLPVFLAPSHIPRLLVAGLVVLAVRGESKAMPWLLLVIGVWMDVTNGLVVGAYTLGFVFLYLLLSKMEKNLLPTKYRYFAVMGLGALFSLLLDIWVIVYGWLSVRFGWPVVVGNFFALEFSTWLRLFLTGGSAFLLYLLWQELSFAFAKPLSIQRNI